MQEDALPWPEEGKSMLGSSPPAKISTAAKSPRLAITANSLHELNNQLAIILTECDLIILQSGPDANLERHVTKVRNAANQITGKLAKLLTD